MFTKWKIEGFSDYRFDENGNLWKIGFKDQNNKYRSHRMIKMQHPDRWLINGVFWSKHQLRQHLILDESPIELTKIKDLPF